MVEIVHENVKDDIGDNLDDRAIGQAGITRSVGGQSR